MPRNVLLDAESSSGIAEPGQSVRGPQQHQRLLPRLAQVEAGIEDDPIGGDTGGQSPPGPVDQKSLHVGHHVVVVRLGVGDAGRQADVGGHHRCARSGGRGQVARVGEAADVVADHGARLVRRRGHRCPPGVDRQRDVEAGVEGLDGRHHPIELLGLAHLRPRAGLDAAHVQDVGALADQFVGPAQKALRVPIGAAVVEGVGRPVQDAHDQGSDAEVVAPVAEHQDGHDGRDYGNG